MFVFRLISSGGSTDRIRVLFFGLTCTARGEYSYSILRYPILYPPFLPSLSLSLPYSCVSPSYPISSGVYAHYSRSRIVVSIPEPILLTQLPVPSS